MAMVRFDLLNVMDTHRVGGRAERRVEKHVAMPTQVRDRVSSRKQTLVKENLYTCEYALNWACSIVISSKHYKLGHQLCLYE